MYSNLWKSLFDQIKAIKGFFIQDIDIVIDRIFMINPALGSDNYLKSIDVDANNISLPIFSQS